METFAISSLRKGNYTSSITDIDDILNIIDTATAGKPYYFTINLKNGTSKVFYYVLQAGETQGSFIAKLYRDYTKYTPSNAMGTYEDFLVKGFASVGAYVQNEPESDAIQTSDSSAKADMLTYAEVFIDAVQVLSEMPY